MHKGIIMLTKANSKEQALTKIKEYIEEYKDNVWDWYQIGGRWSQTLAPKTKQFSKKIKKFDLKYQNNIDRLQSELQNIWFKLGMSGQNPYCNHYNLPDEGDFYDIIKLENCLDIVKKWQQNPIKEGNKRLRIAKKRWLKNKKKPDYNMYGYSLKCAGEIFQQNFSFECNIFNIDAGWGEGFSLPQEKDISNFYAVMLDIHN